MTMIGLNQNSLYHQALLLRVSSNMLPNHPPEYGRHQIIFPLSCSPYKMNVHADESNHVLQL